MCQNINICILNVAFYKRKGFLNIVEIKYKHLNKKVSKCKLPSQIVTIIYLTHIII